MWPGVRRAGLPRQSPALTPGPVPRSGAALISVTAQFGNGTSPAAVRYLTLGVGSVPAVVEVALPSRLARPARRVGPKRPHARRWRAVAPVRRRGGLS